MFELTLFMIDVQCDLLIITQYQPDYKNFVKIRF